MKPKEMPRIGQEIRKRHKLRNKDTLNLRIGTWNVRTLNRLGGPKTLADELKNAKLDITALQETKKAGKNMASFKDYALYYSGTQSASLFGTGFLVAGKALGAVIGFNPIDERMCTLRVKGKFFNITLINCHAPTEEKDDDIKNAFYEKLQKVFERSPKRDVKIVLGDFNAKVGRESIYRPTIGSHSLHTVSNENGCRVVDFAVINNLVIKSTCFPHKDIHKATWKSPDGRTANQIDHIMIDGRHSSSILDVRSCRGPNIDSDHYLVRGLLRARIAAPTKKPPQLWIPDVESLKREDKKRQYTAKVEREIIEAVDDDHQDRTIDEEWDRLRMMVETAAREVLGPKTKKRNEWFDEECRKALESKNNARKKWLQVKTRAASEVYKEKRNFERKLFRRKKAEIEREMFGNVQNLIGVENSRERFRLIKRLRGNSNNQPLLCRDDSGEILADEERCIARWAAYFQVLLNQAAESSEERNTPAVPLNDEVPAIQVDEPTLEEVEAVILKQKNGKAAGSDNLPAELFKNGGDALCDRMHELLLRVWRTESMPEEWKLGVICPLYKKGDKMDCSNYRGITLLNVAYKIFANLLYKRLLPYAEDCIGEYQCGFRRDRSTSDQIFSLRQILEKCREYNIDTHHLFIDFKAAYDSVLRGKLWEIMVNFNFPVKLIRLTRLTLTNVVSKVRIRNQLSNSFVTGEGLRQGDPLATLLFNIALESAIRRTEVARNGTIFQKSIQFLAYADDIDIVGRNLSSVKEAFQQLQDGAREIGLSINSSKTKYMVASSSSRSSESFQLGDNVFERVNNFVYLGSEVNSENEIGQEVRRRITQGNKSFYSLQKCFRSKVLRRNFKCFLYKTLVRPVVTYGSETWCMTQKDEQNLRVFERRILRSIFGALHENGYWRRRYNHELDQLLEGPDIVRTIKVNRLRWLGHVHRMDEGRIPKRLFEGNPAGSRRAGRPRGRWRDQALGDVRRVRASCDWRAVAGNRSDWRRFLEEAKTHNGL